MIHRFYGQGDTGAGYIVKPNQAISWRSLMLVYLVVSTVTIAIGISFYLMGMTLVLPFSGLEILALGVALYVCAWRGGVQEVISVDGDHITVEIGRQCPEQREIFKRAWAQVILERSWNSWYPSRLLIRSHGRQIEIGRFLNEQERQGFALMLSDLLNKNKVTS
jgi:uncharacterized membrane protein